MIEKYQQIVSMLLTLTSEERVEWEKTSGNEYKVSVGKIALPLCIMRQIHIMQW